MKNLPQIWISSIGLYRTIKLLFQFLKKLGFLVKALAIYLDIYLKKGKSMEIELKSL